MKPTTIFYFEREGRENLPQVLRVLKRGLKKRPELRSLKLVIFTSTGEGPALAFAQLHEFEPKIIAVTFPPDFTVKRGEGTFRPRISDKLQAFFDGVGLKVITGRLPFDPIEGMATYNEQLRVIRDTVAIFGGSFSLAIQAVLSACDAGQVGMGEKVVVITGDVAAIVTASSTRKFLTKGDGLAVNEILCKPRNLTYGRKADPSEGKSTGPAYDEKKLASRILDVYSLPENNPKKNE